MRAGRLFWPPDGARMEAEVSARSGSRSLCPHCWSGASGPKISGLIYSSSIHRDDINLRHSLVENDRFGSISSFRHFGSAFGRFSSPVSSFDSQRIDVCVLNNLIVRNLRAVAWQTHPVPEFSSSPLRSQTRLYADIDRSNRGEKRPIDEKDGKDARKPDIAKDLSSTAQVEEIDDSKLSLTQRFKKMLKQYWYVIVPVHAVTYVGWFGLFYAISASGIDIVAFLEFLHVPDSVLDHIRNAPGAGHFVIAFALNKIASPLRYMTTLGVSYYAVKSLSRLGYIKPMPNRKQLKAIYDEKKDAFSRNRHRWRQERRFMVFKKRPVPPPPSNGQQHHHHQHPKKPQT